MAVNQQNLLAQAVAAFAGKAGAGGKAVMNQAQAHLNNLAHIAAAIEAGHLAGTISSAEAAQMLKMQKLAFETIALSASGKAMVAIENGINAAINVVIGAVKTATGFPLTGV